MSFFCRIFGHTPDADGVCRRCGTDTRSARVPSRALRFRRMKGTRECALVGAGKCRDTAVVVPAYHRGRPVRKIAARAFAHYLAENDSATPYTVELPRSVECIGPHAFAHSALTDVTYGNESCTLGEGVFYGCHALDHAPLPAALSELPARALARCTSLVSIDLDERILSIGEGALAGCAALEHLSYNDKQAVLGAHALEGCVKLAEITLPPDMAALPDRLLYGCESLTAVRLPERLQLIGEGALAFCCQLETLTLPNTLSELGASALMGCSSLRALSFPPSLTLIGGDETSEGGALEGCECLQSIELYPGIVRFPARMLSGCRSLVDIELHGTSADWRAIQKDETFDLDSATYVVHCVNGRIRKGH